MFVIYEGGVESSGLTFDLELRDFRNAGLSVCKEEGPRVFARR